jgi:hypothetical protein
MLAGSFGEIMPSRRHVDEHCSIAGIRNEIGQCKALRR